MTASSYLRPMGLRDILDEAFNLYKDNFTLFFGIIVTTLLPLQLLLGLASGTDYLSESTSDANADLTLTGGLLILLNLFIFSLIVGALTMAVSERYLGRVSSYRYSYQFMLKHILSFIITFSEVILLISIVLFILFSANYLTVNAFYGESQSMLFVVLTSLLIALSIIIGSIYCLLFAFVIPIFVIEGKTGGAAIRRSWILFLFNLKKNIGIISLSSILSILIMFILIVPFGLSMRFINYDNQSFFHSILFQRIVDSLFPSLVYPILIIAIILLYFDARIRREGYDLEIMAVELGSVSPASDAASQWDELKPDAAE